MIPPAVPMLPAGRTQAEVDKAYGDLAEAITAPFMRMAAALNDALDALTRNMIYRSAISRAGANDELEYYT